jgi:hypothetical protein
MAEDNNNTSVELDTDGVQEQEISVETPNDSGSAFEKKEEVDLGYTDVSNKKLLRNYYKRQKKLRRLNLKES